MYKIRGINFKSSQDIEKMLLEMGVDAPGIKIMVSKAQFQCIRLEAVPVSAAHILKQEMLSIGGDAAVAKEVIAGKVTETPVLLMGTYQHYQRLIKKLKIQPFRLAQLSKHIEQLLAMINKAFEPLVFKNSILPINQRTAIIGTIDIASPYFLEDCKAIEDEGADLISVTVKKKQAKEELERSFEMLDKLLQKTALPSAIETDNMQVIKTASRLGVEMVFIKDELQNNSEIFPEIIANNLYVVISCKYPLDNKNAAGSLIECCKEQINLAGASGINIDKLMIAPGIEPVVVNMFDELKMLGKPIVMDMANKNTTSNNKIEQLAALAAFGISKGVNIIKAGNVKELVAICKMVDAITRR